MAVTLPASVPLAVLPKKETGIAATRPWWNDSRFKPFIPSAIQSGG